MYAFSRYGSIRAGAPTGRRGVAAAAVVTARHNVDGSVPMTLEGMLVDPPQRHTVHGDHQAMRREPNARELAGLLRAEIDDALRRAPGALTPP